MRIITLLERGTFYSAHNTNCLLWRYWQYCRWTQQRVGTLTSQSNDIRTGTEHVRRRQTLVSLKYCTKDKPISWTIRSALQTFCW